ncbi:MAG: DNA polymerase III subunit delta [Planctomycetes bacterium]|nr:DNA polymerase III subunit delta [Planctomycetota bacterium]
MAKTSKSLDALTYLAAADKHPPRPVCVVYGDEAFLRTEVLSSLKGRLLGEEQDADFSLAVLEGPKVELADVLDRLSTVAMFGGARVVVVEDADDFVKRYRGELEDYVARPATGAFLLLVLQTFPSNTRLYKVVAEHGLAVACGALDGARLLRWMADRAKSKYGVVLEAPAAEMLLEQVEPAMGLLDQELAKLSLLAQPDGKITAQLVRETVGGWRAKTTWDMLDAALDGHPQKTLRQLDRLILAGEAPIAILGQISYTLRRLAAATRLIEQSRREKRGITLPQALKEAGFKTWPAAMQKAERQLRTLGRLRGGRLYHWLQETDLALKGERSAPALARFELERLLVRLSAPADQVVPAEAAGAAR